MRKILKKYSGVVYIALMTVIVALVLVNNNDMGQIFAALRTMDLRWLSAASLCIGMYLFLRMATLRYYLRCHGHRISWREAMGVTGAGQFYSAITPSSSGGQPMQVLWLHRLGVPASLGTACVSVKFIGFQVAILLLGGVLWLADRQKVSAQLYGFRWLVLLGFAINAGLIAAIFLAILCRGLLDRFIGWLLRLGKRLKLVRRPDVLRERFQLALEDYCAALLTLQKDPVEALVILGLSALQTLVYMGLTVCLYRAFALSGTGLLTILAIQFLLFIAAAFVPLPGAAGAQESGFYVFFQGIFPQGNLVAAMVCWRFFSYYLLMVAGLAMMALGRSRRRLEPANEKDEQAAA